MKRTMIIDYSWQCDNQKEIEKSHAPLLEAKAFKVINKEMSEGKVEGELISDDTYVDGDGKINLFSYSGKWSLKILSEAEMAVIEMIEADIKRADYIKMADSVLSTHDADSGLEGDEAVQDMINRIQYHHDNVDEDDLIDNVDGVDVWEKMENEFTCKQFLIYIGLKK